jgi:hypothetical protein
MSRSTSRTIVAVLAGVVLASVVALAANAAFGRTAAPSPAPRTPPTVAPSLPPADPPTAPPTGEPSAPPSQPPADGATTVDLENLTSHDVSVVIDDQTEQVVKAESGTPGDGMSVRWFDVKVENIDSDTLRIVWVGLPRDEVVDLGVSERAGKVRLRFIQDAPPRDSDAIGFDRILELTFEGPVRSEDVVTSVEER